MAAKALPLDCAISLVAIAVVGLVSSKSCEQELNITKLSRLISENLYIVFISYFLSFL
jgi:hypothetical protein